MGPWGLSTGCSFLKSTGLDSARFFSPLMRILFLIMHLILIICILNMHRHKKINSGFS